MAQKQKKNKKWNLWLILVILFVVAVVVVYFIWNSSFKGEEDELEPSDNTWIENKNDDGGDSESEIVEKPKVVQYDGDDPNTLDELSGVVTYAGVVEDKLMIRINIDQYLEVGECTLILTRNGENIYSSSTGIVSNVTIATCEGFDVPVAGLGQGNMEIEINITSNGKSGLIRSEVSI